MVSRLARLNRLYTQQRHLDMTALELLDRIVKLPLLAEQIRKFNTQQVRLKSPAVRLITRAWNMVPIWYKVVLSHGKTTRPRFMSKRYITLTWVQRLFNTIQSTRRDFRAIRPLSNLASNLLWSPDHESLPGWLHIKSLASFTIHQTTASYDLTEI
jgi:hypothetical protein